MLSGPELRAAAARHDALVGTDNDFQRRARLRQSIWREYQGLRIGEHRGRPLGSRLEMPYAQDTLCNYLTETIRGVVRQEVMDPLKSSGKLYAKPRIFNDLLSSQPMAFNLFAELKADLALASRVFTRLIGFTVNVSSIAFEHSPGRGDPRYTGDRSAFDVFVEYESKDAERDFLGIEVKYHEGLGDKPSPHRQRYDEIADLMGCFPAVHRALLRDKPLQQIWRDHLLACSLLCNKDAGFESGRFVFLYPAQNDRCANAASRYRACLTDPNSFDAWTLDEVVATIESETRAPWIRDFRQRYLAIS